ncbi:N-glycosyltransferase [Serinicoccus hydrothermalis]|uniref:N-glycosyltransferase n=1 Tax=Serinicoccus hydrothermalis TaxID=1758689 RepID=A0A1B1NDT0_9MICO|nr:glycosyltransferase [Serinicoccus hydrothermalis]ANS79597.1 N-glycosyltransferase [Serinicoccus hydrothermalis]
MGPTAPIVRALVERGHEVTVITGQRYRHTFDSLGARTTPLPPEVDFDDTDLDGSIPGRAGLSGLRLARFDLTRFVEAMPHQLRVVDEELDRSPVDVVLCDPLFLAGMPLVLRPRTERPRVLALGFLPLMAPLPALPPPTNPLASARNAAIRRVARRFLRPITRLAHEQVRALTGVGTDLLPFDWPTRSEGILQMTAPGFEYPRTTADVPAPIHFVGPTTTSATTDHPLPPWWEDLDGDRPVVHVTQGTIANADLGQLLEPTIAGLADADVLVVATTCGGTLSVDPLPDNVRVADFLPYDELLPRCDVMVTNGGYGGVNHALRYAVPLVCVGASEDKRDVAARVTWSGVGVGISRPSLTPRAARRAVDRVLAGTAYRSRARELADQIAAGPSTDEVVALICGPDPT